MHKLVFTLILATITAQANATTIFLNMKKMLGPYPELGSAGSEVDFTVLHFYQNTRTEAQCAEAKAEEKPNLKTFFGRHGGPLSEKEVRRLSPLFLLYAAELGINAYIAKSTFKRPRPYVTDPSLVPCVKRADKGSYPSGHTALARFYAHLLGEIYPERKVAFMKRADQVSLNRVIGGAHHPTDLVAGKKLGDELAKIYVKSGRFETDLANLQ